MLDLVLAGNFGLPQAKALVSSGSDLDLSDREKFLESLHDDKEKKVVAQVETLSKRPDLRFFHWELEFPEVFTGFFDPNQTKIMHKDRIKKGSAGFDVVIGNPPYVRQEALKPIKNFLKDRFKTFDSMNDLYVYFQEMEVFCLRYGGRMGMIVANKWMRSGYGERLRGYLRRIGQPLEVIDFGHSPIFPDADTFPCITIVARRHNPIPEHQQTPQGEDMLACEIPRTEWSNQLDLLSYTKQHAHKLPTVLLRDEGWSLENPKVQALLDTIRNTGRSLRDHVGSELFRGVLTGCNAAFYISPEVRDGLIKKDRRSAELIKSQLRGQDVGRWLPSTNGVYLLFVRRGIDIQKYPAVLQHLMEYRDQLKPKPSTWDDKKDGNWRGRKAGPYEWYEIQDSTAYYQLFDRPKIVVQCIGYHSRWALDSHGFYVNNKTFFIPTDDLVLLAILNSPLLWWYMWRDFPHMKDEALSIDGQCVERLPIPHIPEPLADNIGKRTESILVLTKEIFSIHEETARIVEGLTGVKISPKELTDLPPSSILQRLKKQMIVRKIETRLLSQLESVLSESKARQVEKTKLQLSIERVLSGLVQDAYGISDEEGLLLRSTRPVRDPLDTLEDNIQGREVENDGI